MSDLPALSILGSFKDAELESQLRQDRAERLRRWLTVSFAAATAVFLAYGLHDALVVPSIRSDAWFVRYAVFAPIAVLTLGMVRTRYLVPLGQALGLLYGCAACFVVLYIAGLAPRSAFYLYASYAVIFVTLGPFVARLNPLTQLVYTGVVLLMYLVLDTRSAGIIRVSMSSTLVSLGALGAVLAFQLEKSERLAFIQQRLITRQMRELEAERERSEELLLNVLPPSIAQRLKGNSQLIADGFERVSVLFADIVGFTKMSQRLAPEELVSRLNLVFSSFDDLVDKLKLEKIKTIGDAYMCAGGLHSLEYDHAEAVAEMALAMKRRLHEFSAEFGEALDIRIGIHTGPVVAGVIGKKKFIYDVWGDTVNTASRMESHAEPGTIQVSETSYELLKDTYEFEARGSIEIKGKGPMRTYYLIGRPPTAKGKPMAKTFVPRKLPV
jgi:class 3 adenylate cyclase